MLSQIATDKENMINNYFSSVFRASKLLIKFPNRRTGKIHLKRCISDISDDTEEFDFAPDEEAADKLVEELCANDAKKLSKLNHVRLLVSLQRHRGKEVPEQLTPEQWMRLLSYDNKNDQVGYLSNLFKREKNRAFCKTVRDAGFLQYQENLRAEQEQGPIKITTSGPIIYRLRYNTLFYRVLDYAFEKFYNYKLLQAMMFGSPVVVDCGFESSMRQKEIDIIAARIVYMWAQNRNHVSPFHIQLCNLNPVGRMMERLRGSRLRLDDPAYPFFHTNKSYLELYPSERLVYLTQDAHHDLKEFNSDDVYILGGLGNYMQGVPLIKLKANRERIRTAKLPIKRYNVKYARSQSNLDLPLVLSILNDVKTTNNWRYAFRHLDVRQYVGQHGTDVAPDHSIKSRERLGLTYDLLLTQSRNNAQN